MEFRFEEWEEDARALRIVSPAYAGRDGELNATLQYVYQACMLEGCGEKPLAQELLHIAVDEMHHLHALGVAIARLGAQPVFSACPPYPVSFYKAACVDYSVRPREMLCADICGEEEAIRSYSRMMQQLGNPAVRELIAWIRGEEERHLARLKELLSSL